MNSKTKAIFKIALYFFALVGFVFSIVYIGMQFGAFNVRGSIGSRNAFFQKPATPVIADSPCSDSRPLCEWNETPQWAVVKGGLEKDASLIQKVSAETGVSARMIASVVVPEQTRFFTAEREVFKRYFEPLKILGSLSQFSLGVSGIKQITANDIEKYAKDTTSPLYPGDGYDSLIAYPENTNHDSELYNRLTDPKNHYYQYLYTALFIKEIEAQWSNAGFDISEKPEVVVTLFNLGFQASHPNPTPATGGAGISTGGVVLAYGELGSRFYHSDELRSIFP